MFKNLLYTLLLAVLAVGVQGQSQTSLDKGMQYLQKKAASWQIETGEQDVLVSDMYTDAKTGITYIYFQQAVDGIPVANAITPVLINKLGKAYNVASAFIPEAKAKVVKSNEKLDAADAIKYAADALGIKSGTIPNSARSAVDGVYDFGVLDIAHNDIKVKKEYVLVNDQLVLAWDLSLDMKESADYWNTKISAADGTMVYKQNYTVYCQHEHGKFAKHYNCGATKVVKSEKKAVKVAEANAALLMGGTYNVFAFPVESPIHGERSIISDDQFPDASPHGWHDIDNNEGAEFTITRGNNAHAFLDKQDSNFSSDDEPDGGAELMFDYDYSLDTEAADQEAVSVTNLFAAVNQIHDITYRLGFHEMAGNFQQNTYGNGGLGQDYVVAQAFDGIDLFESGADDTKINNANFSTPADGASGRMQMFLWENSGGSLSIDEPSNISGFIQQIGTSVAAFGGVIPTADDPPITGKVVLARDADPASPTQSCGDIVNGDEIAGNIALIDRGLCNFSLKAYNAQRAGAITCLICNVPGADGPGSSGENVINMASGINGDDVTITPIFVQKSVCDRIRAEINNGVDVIMTLQERDPIGPTYRDAAFDNGVIAHEYGHGISNRLIGGPGQAGCLNSAEQMGEGISDFVSLLLTVEEGDAGTDARGIGNYVDFLAPGAGGIRTYPYSTDLALNPRTYEEVPGFIDADGNPLIYSVGEVWTIALWEMYWNLVDEKGLDITWTNEESGNYVAGRLFIEGMKAAPCNPTLVEMRDAIITMDEMLYNGENALAIWTAFAKRGLGYQATGGTSGSITDGTANFEIFPLAIQTLKIEKSAKSLVTAGEEVEITLLVKNHVPEAKSGVVVMDQVPDGATFIEGSASTGVTQDGADLTFEVGAMEYQDEVTVTYKIRVNDDIKSNTLFFDDVDGTDIGNYDIQLIEGFSFWNKTDLDANSGESSLYVRESDNEANDQYVQLDNIEVTGERPVLRFFHKYDTEQIIDGGFMRVSEDGEIFTLVADKFIRGNYNANLEYSTFAIPNLRGFSGSSNGEWVDSYVDLSDYKGKTVSLQFRFGSDEMNAANVDNPGWFVDDIELVDLASFGGIACVMSDTGDDEQCSNDLEFIVNSNGIVSTEDEILAAQYKINIGPNPTSEYVTVSIASEVSGQLQLDLMTTDGRVLRTQNVANGKAAVRTFDLANVTSGIYLVSVRSGQNILATKKVVVQK